jgi:O-antigen ligase
VRLELPPRYLAGLLVGTVLCMTVGTPIALSASGRTLTLGPTDGFVVLLLVMLPLWFRRLPPPSTFVVCAVLFVLWVWIDAVFWSLDYRRSVLTAKALLEAAVVYLAAWHVAESGETWAFPRAIRLMNAVLTLQIAWAVGRVLTGPAQGYYALKSEVQLPLGGSNFLALFLEFGLLFELLARRRWWIVFAAVDVLGILLTLSRGALLATGATLMVTSLAMLGMRGQRAGFLVVAGTAAVAGVVLATTPVFRVLVDAFAILSRSAGLRIEIWKVAWQAAAWRPITGVGYGAYASVGAVRDVHSLPIALLAETGIVGLALFALALLAVLGRVVKVAVDSRTGTRRAEALGVAAGLGVVLLHSLIEPFFLGFSMVWSAVIFAWIAGPWWPTPERPSTVGAGVAAPVLRAGQQ